MTWVAVAIGGSALVGAGAGIYSSKQASKAAKGTKAQQALEAGQLETINKTRPLGLEFLGDAKKNYGQVEDFYQLLAGGDRSKLLELFGPELSAEDEGMSNALSMDALLSPSGSASPERRLGILDNAFARRGNALMSLRPQGIAGLGTLAGEKASLGGNILSGNASSSTGLLGAILGRQGMAFDQQRAAGQSLFQLLQLFGSMGGGRSGGGTTTAALPAYSNTLSNVNQFAPGVRG
jgi:hypothetical protein